jgi:hypothetical protein
VKRRKGTKAKSPKRRCDKVDARIGKGVPGGGFDIDRVMILLQWLGHNQLGLLMCESFLAFALSTCMF